MTVGLWSLFPEPRARRNTLLRARRNRHLTIRIATKTPEPRKLKFCQQSFVAAVAAPVGASSVIRSTRREVEVRVLCAGAVIGEAERFHNQFIEGDLSPLAAAAARMQQHALDDDYFRLYWPVSDTAGQPQ